jgi:hypothetical protein
MIAGAADGMQAVLQEAQRQAAAAAQMLQSGQLQQQFAGKERLVGGQGGGFVLPADARQVAASTTATGIEVVVNHAGRKLLLQAAAAARSSSDRGGRSSLAANSSSSRQLLGAASALVIPPPADALHLKPGADSSVLTALGSKANSLAQADMLVWIGYQKSHRMMGKARLHCTSGCVCRDVIVDAWHAAKVSHMAMAKLRVTQHEACRIGVEVLGQSSSGHHKFRVAALMVSRAVEYHSNAGTAAAPASGVADGGDGAGVHPDVALMSALQEAGT